jgi:hypothetical protein
MQVECNGPKKRKKEKKKLFIMINRHTIQLNVHGQTTFSQGNHIELINFPTINECN